MLELALVDLAHTGTVEILAWEKAKVVGKTAVIAPMAIVRQGKLAKKVFLWILRLLHLLRLLHILTLVLQAILICLLLLLLIVAFSKGRLLILRLNLAVFILIIGVFLRLLILSFLLLLLHFGIVGDIARIR